MLHLNYASRVQFLIREIYFYSIISISSKLAFHSYQHQERGKSERAQSYLRIKITLSMSDGKTVKINVMGSSAG